MSELLWIAVPGGTADGGDVVLRVLVVPKLDGGTLAGSGMQTWPPPDLLGATLNVEWRKDDDGEVTGAEVPPDRITFQAQAGLWRRFFGPATDVGNPGRAVAAHVPPEVSPTSADADRIATTYAGPARVELDPQASGLPADFGVNQLQGLKEWKQADQAPPRPATAQGAEPPPPPDFHRVISLLREHPAVLRRLGLSFELRATPPDALKTAGQVRVRWLRDEPPPPEAAGPFVPPLPSIVSPWTRYGRAFLPDASDGTISAGMVTLTPDPAAPEAVAAGNWTVIAVDVEGGTRRLRDAASLVKDDDAAAGQADQRRPVSLPAMRSAGLQLVRPNRAEDFAKRAEISRANLERETLDGYVLDATDLVLGYRIDVKRGGGEWRSLHERTATYEVDGVTIGDADIHEEGHLKAMGAVREDDGVLRADEVVARWDGWSLSVPRPRFDDPAGGAGPSRLGGLPFEFTWGFTVPPRSLPALRFTETYALRARVVDIAGGGLELDDPAADRCQITEIPYGRYEPVPSPALTLEPGAEARPFGPGEAVDHVVVRSGPGVTVDEFAAGNPGYLTNARRQLHRPQTSLDIAEQHDMLRNFDDARMADLVRRVQAHAGGPASPEGPLPDPAASGVRAFAQPGPGAPTVAVASREWTTKPWPESDGPKLLELRDRKPGETPVKFEGETLVVRLAPAEQLTLDISSSLTGNFLDHFALQEQFPALSKTTAKVGGHPLITPSRPVTLVHAVRRPLSRTSDAMRLISRDGQPGQTFAILDPEQPSPGVDENGTPQLADLDIDANSTSQLDVTAAWTERQDDVVRQVTGAPVQSIVIDRGETALKDPLRQEFGDTRYREVTYTLTAASRFRQLFAADEDPEEFLAATTLPPTRILNTARPAAPVVLATRPAFTWTESTAEIGEITDPETIMTVVTRTRLGGRLRVELARPWYQTGDGERLALLLWNRPETDPADHDMSGYVSQAGRDPIWDTPTPARWPALSMLSPDVAGTEALALVPEKGLSVLAVPYEPWFHNDRWYADIALPGVAASSYCPFIQLALGRYQPGSIKGISLSPIVRTEMVQLLPDRTLTVRRRLIGPNRFVVRLDGRGPAGPQANRVDVLLERCEPPPGVDFGAVDLIAFSPTDGRIPAWVPIPGATQHTQLGTDIEMHVPPGGGALRVRVREVEQVGQVIDLFHGGQPTPQAGTPGEMNERVTFTDTVLVP